MKPTYTNTPNKPNTSNRSNTPVYNYIFNLYDTCVMGSYGIFPIDLHRIIEYPLINNDFSSEIGSSGTIPGSSGTNQPTDGSISGSSGTTLGSNNTNHTNSTPSTVSTTSSAMTSVSDYTAYLHNTMISVIADPHPAKHGMYSVYIYMCTCLCLFICVNVCMLTLHTLPNYLTA